jgi:hypothetical protein
MADGGDNSLGHVAAAWPIEKSSQLAFDRELQGRKLPPAPIQWKRIGVHGTGLRRVDDNSGNRRPYLKPPAPFFILPSASQWRHPQDLILLQEAEAGSHLISADFPVR